MSEPSIGAPGSPIGSDPWFSFAGEAASGSPATPGGDEAVLSALRHISRFIRDDKEPGNAGATA